MHRVQVRSEFFREERNLFPCRVTKLNTLAVELVTILSILYVVSNSQHTKIYYYNENQRDAPFLRFIW